ncbi:hypothetical protein BD626DRAFT_483610 [Schizophyllum amplum]|uniref:Uncharacterized protein n=1 Tax=Schizophyllum amplum TaxID=97359 RepID=A0A550CPM8_9AGAR|nr:hypothetical protein BD626DRAFT_483610 [Auriculariopsis ampla]
MASLSPHDWGASSHCELVRSQVSALREYEPQSQLERQSMHMQLARSEDRRTLFTGR